MKRCTRHWERLVDEQRAAMLGFIKEQAGSAERLSADQAAGIEVDWDGSREHDSAVHDEAVVDQRFRRGLLSVTLKIPKRAKTPAPPDISEKTPEETDEITHVIVDLFNKLIEPVVSQMSDLAIGAFAGSAAGGTTVRVRDRRAADRVRDRRRDRSPDGRRDRPRRDGRCGDVDQSSGGVAEPQRIRRGPQAARGRDGECRRNGDDHGSPTSTLRRGTPTSSARLPSNRPLYAAFRPSFHCGNAQRPDPIHENRLTVVLYRLRPKADAEQFTRAGLEGCRLGRQLEAADGGSCDMTATRKILSPSRTNVLMLLTAGFGQWICSIIRNRLVSNGFQPIKRS